MSSHPFQLHFLLSKAQLTKLNKNEPVLITREQLSNENPQSVVLLVDDKVYKKVSSNIRRGKGARLNSGEYMFHHDRVAGGKLNFGSFLKGIGKAASVVTKIVPKSVVDAGVGMLSAYNPALGMLAQGAASQLYPSQQAPEGSGFFSNVIKGVNKAKSLYENNKDAINQGVSLVKQYAPVAQNLVSSYMNKGQSAGNGLSNGQKMARVRAFRNGNVKGKGTVPIGSGFHRAHPNHAVHIHNVAHGNGINPYIDSLDLNGGNFLSKRLY